MFQSLVAVFLAHGTVEAQPTWDAFPALNLVWSFQTVIRVESGDNPDKDRFTPMGQWNDLTPFFTLPPNEPICGFDGRKPECNSEISFCSFAPEIARLFWARKSPKFGDF